MSYYSHRNSSNITLREVLCSIIIVGLMFILGLFITSKVMDHARVKQIEYDTALQIDDDQTFTHALHGGYGNAFVYGTVTPVDTVGCYELGGQHMYVERVLETYESHEEEETYEDEDGNEHTRTITVWDWEEQETVTDHSKKLNFRGVEFDYDTLYHFGFLGARKYLDTTYFDDWNLCFDSGECRYTYYAIDNVAGTYHADLNDGNFMIKDFSYNTDIEHVLKNGPTDKAKWGCVFIWLVLIVITALLVITFCEKDNSWLETGNDIDVFD